MTKEEKNKSFEARQIVKLEKEKKKPKTAFYFFLIVVLILLVDILDNFTTNTPGYVQSNVIYTFFPNNTVEGFAIHNAVSLISYVIGLIAPFYKALGDKYGRKPLFVLSTLGMTLGLFITLISSNYVVFMVGSVISQFFLGNDIQILYILEEAPSDKRATVYSLVKALGGLSSLSIPFLRGLILNEDGTNWRQLYLIPAIFGIVVAALVFLLARETSTFVKERSELLAIPYETRQEQIRKEKEDKKKSGIIPAIKYIFRHKPIRNLLIIKCIFDIAILAIQNTNIIMRDDFGYSEQAFTKAGYFFPIFYCLSVLVSGFLADMIGRKKVVCIFGSVTLVTFILFIVFCNRGLSPVLIGIMYGLYLGGYWIGRDYMEIIATEMVPTGIRSSVIGAFALLVYSGMAVGFGLNALLPMLVGKFWISSLIITVPAVLVSVVLLAVLVKETKGVDYDAIENDL